MSTFVLTGVLAASLIFSVNAFAQAAGAGADYNKADRERSASPKEKTYTEKEIYDRHGGPNTGKPPRETDVRRVGKPNPSTRDK